MPYLVLLVSLLAVGVAPRLLTDHIEPSARSIVDAVARSRSVPNLAAAPGNSIP